MAVAHCCRGGEVMRGALSANKLLLQRFCGSMLLLGGRELGCVAHEETAMEVERSWRGCEEGSGIRDGDGGRAGAGTAAAAAAGRRRRRVGGDVVMVERPEEQRGGQGVQWVFLGCPGVGKGTYASRLSKLLHVPHIAMGDLVRQELSKSSSMAKQELMKSACSSHGSLLLLFMKNLLGADEVSGGNHGSSLLQFMMKLATLMSQGQLLPDDIIIRLLSKRLEESMESGQSGFILDGFPRTVHQAEMMQEVADVDLVVNLKLREDALIVKCLGRRICSQCGGNFNLAHLEMEESNSAPRIFMPPLLPPPSCASKMTIRADDTEEVVRRRLRIYYEESKPVEDFYRRSRKLLDFEVSGGIPETWPRLLAALNIDEKVHTNNHDDSQKMAA